MAFFKFRKAVDESASAAPAPQSIDTIRQRAKYRLVGASVLVLLGVIGFPLLFDKQPRPIAVDTPIDIPDRNKVAPLVLPALPASVPDVLKASAPVPAQPEASAPSTLKAAPPVVSASEPGVITEATESVKAEKKSESKVPLAAAVKASEAINNVASEVPKTSKLAASAAVAKVSDSAKAQAILEAKALDQPVATDGRFVVQVGAFAESVRAQEVRQKLERAGLKTYTQVAETKDGKRIRVRVGPFAARSDAEKVAEKIKKLSLPAALLTL